MAIDRANLNTPNREGRAFTGFIHWDADTSLNPLPIGVQGVLSLADTDSETGGFQCVPELFRTLEAWIRTQPTDCHPFHPDLTGFEIVPVPMKAGDLLIFNSLLAHGIRPNVSNDRVRVAQYISMYPAEEDNIAEREARVRSWREREAPKRAAFPGDPRDWGADALSDRGAHDVGREAGCSQLARRRRVGFPSPFVLYTAADLARTAGQLAREVSGCDARFRSSGCSRVFSSFRRAAKIPLLAWALRQRPTLHCL